MHYHFHPKRFWVDIYPIYLYIASMTKPGPKPMVKPAWHPADDLTEMQRRFVDFLAYRQGRSTFTKAAIEAGYSEKRANREGSELMKNPIIK